MRAGLKTATYDEMFPRKKDKRSGPHTPNGIGGGSVSQCCQKAINRTEHAKCFVITCSCSCHSE